MLDAPVDDELFVLPLFVAPALDADGGASILPVSLEDDDFELLPAGLAAFVLLAFAPPLAIDVPLLDDCRGANLEDAAGLAVCAGNSLVTLPPPLPPALTR